MATATKLSVNMKATGVSVTVPEDDTARLMYYLRSVTLGVGLDIIQDDLVDWRNYWKLGIARKVAVYKAAVEFSPDEFIGKVLFRDDEGDVCKGTSQNEFCDISVACDVVSIQRDVLIAGKVQNLTKVMFFKSSWLEKYYTGPTMRLARVVLGSKHCAHCKGVDGVCACENCPRSSDSQCEPLVSALLGLLTGTSISPRSPSPAPPPRITAPTHSITCDGCLKRGFDGKRYKCKVCNDYDLCPKCYQNDVHDTAHPFLQIDRPGATPQRLSPRSPTAHDCTCDGCRKEGFEGPRYKCAVCDDYDLCKTCYTGNKHDLTHAFKQIDRRGSVPRQIAPRRVIPPPPSFRLFAVTPPKPVQPPPPPSRVTPTAPPPPSRITPTAPPAPPSYAASTGSPYFYHDMSVSELKEYLKERGVAYIGIFDRETLCRSVWDTHCDCMSMSELTAFLSENNISTADCRDIASRRQKAKNAYQNSRKSTTTPAPSVKRNDVVTLQGLTRAEMNGKRAIVVQPDCGGGRTEVRIEESGKLVKVKFENVSTASNDLDEFLD